MDILSIGSTQCCGKASLAALLAAGSFVRQKDIKVFTLDINLLH